MLRPWRITTGYRFIRLWYNFKCFTMIRILLQQMITKQVIFRFFITTRHLIEFSSNFNLVLQADGTCKLTWVGNPILIVGASDFDRVFVQFNYLVVLKRLSNLIYSLSYLQLFQIYQHIYTHIYKIKLH